MEIKKQDKKQAKTLAVAALPVEILTQEDMSVLTGGKRHQATGGKHQQATGGKNQQPISNAGGQMTQVGVKVPVGIIAI